MTALLNYVPSLRGDAMLLTHGREGTERLIAAALLLDGILGDHLDVTPPAPERRREGIEPFGARLDRRRVVAGPVVPDAPLLAELRERVLTTPDSARGWVERAAKFAPTRTAAELVAAGAAAPHAGRFTLSVNARAEAGARDRAATSAPLAALLPAWPLPPSTHTLPPAARAILAAIRT